MFVPVEDMASLYLREVRAPDLSERNVVLIRLFIAFQLVGLFGAFLMLITVLYSSTLKSQRHATWYNFVVAWIVSTTSYSLLFFSGQQEVAVPNYNVCFAQATLVYAAPPLTAAASLGLVVQLWFTVRRVLYGPYKRERFWNVLVIILPYIIHMLVIIEAVVMSSFAPNSIRRTGSGMYCNSGNPIPGRVSAILVSLIMIPVLVFEVMIGVTLRKHWSTFKHNHNAMSMIIRVFVFTVFGIFSLGLGVLFIFTLHHGADLNVLLSTLPVAAVLVFGTQLDIIETWMFWKKSKPPPLPLKDPRKKGFEDITIIKGSLV